jgi:hypothetical protein
MGMTIVPAGASAWRPARAEELADRLLAVPVTARTADE